MNRAFDVELTDPKTAREQWAQIAYRLESLLEQL